MSLLHTCLIVYPLSWSLTGSLSSRVGAGGGGEVSPDYTVEVWLRTYWLWQVLAWRVLCAGTTLLFPGTGMPLLLVTDPSSLSYALTLGSLHRLSAGEETFCDHPSQLLPSAYMQTTCLSWLPPAAYSVFILRGLSCQLVPFREPPYIIQMPKDSCKSSQFNSLQECIEPLPLARRSSRYSDYSSEQNKGLHLHGIYILQ